MTQKKFYRRSARYNQKEVEKEEFREATIVNIDLLFPSALVLGEPDPDGNALVHSLAYYQYYLWRRSQEEWRFVSPNYAWLIEDCSDENLPNNASKFQPRDRAISFDWGNYNPSPCEKDTLAKFHRYLAEDFDLQEILDRHDINISIDAIAANEQYSCCSEEDKQQFYEFFLDFLESQVSTMTIAGVMKFKHCLTPNAGAIVEKYLPPNQLLWFDEKGIFSLFGAKEEIWEEMEKDPDYEPPKTLCFAQPINIKFSKADDIYRQAIDDYYGADEREPVGMRSLDSALKRWERQNQHLQLYERNPNYRVILDLDNETDPEKALEQVRFRKAKKIEEDPVNSHQMLFCPGFGFGTIAELKAQIREIRDDRLHCYSYFWKAKEDKAQLISPKELAETILENYKLAAPSSTIDSYSIDRLKNDIEYALFHFDKANPSSKSWIPDYSTAILINWEV